MIGRSAVSAVYHTSTISSSCALCVLLLAIQTEEMKVKKSIKDAAKKGQTDVAKILAKEMVQSRKAVSKLYASKAQMNSVVMSMQQQLCELYSIHQSTDT